MQTEALPLKLLALIISEYIVRALLLQQMSELIEMSLVIHCR